MDVASEKILLVDDDPNLLASFRRILRNKVDLTVAESGARGLEILAEQGPFAVIISDMRMPEMSGVEFLSQVGEVAPDTVRIMLTGNADLQTAIDAINEGRIFRFLTKPCPIEVLSRVLILAIRQYRLHTLERELLEKTVHGVVELLTELLGMVNPLAFSEAARIKRYMRHLAQELGLADVWEYEMAAMLSQVGCVTLPPEVLGKVLAGLDLTPAEQKCYADYPRVTAQLLRHIPRLERVAHMIEAKDAPFRLMVLPHQLRPDQQVSLGGHLLKVSLAYDRLRLHGRDHEAALQALKSEPEAYDSVVLGAFSEPERGAEEHHRTALPVAQLSAGMVLMEDVRARNGMLLVTRGQEITHAILLRLHAFAENVGVREPVQVMINLPATGASAGR